MCKLISRDTLVEAEPANGVFAVHRLRFAFPNGSIVPIPGSAHVKVQAPDAERQFNRVRAYSMLVDGNTFKLTVKVRIAPLWIMPLPKRCKCRHACRCLD
jgi:hypothetical protein